MILKNQTYRNLEGIEYTVTGLWFIGFDLSKIELTKGKKEFIYPVKDFEKAVSEGKLIKTS